MMRLKQCSSFHMACGVRVRKLSYFGEVLSYAEPSTNFCFKTSREHDQDDEDVFDCRLNHI